MCIRIEFEFVYRDNFQACVFECAQTCSRMCMCIVFLTQVSTQKNAHEFDGIPSNVYYYKFNYWEYFDVPDVISLHQKSLQHLSF